ncbi:MAG: VacJ family lipoprotein [Burkholderiaceae bacterium]|nr:VacJ family lipoprotein [Burkholderiaceae bacterium]
MKTHIFCKHLLIGLLAILSGCATQSVTTPIAADPWESSNRTVFDLNDTIDRAVLKPVARAYAYFTPQPVRSCVNNIFLNIGDIWAGVNSSLQGRHLDAINTFGRVMLNTTLGVGGCFDLASTTGAKRIPNDFGVTLGVWGISSGPYIVLPIIGASTLRDGSGMLVDAYVNQFGYGQQVHDIAVRNSIYGLEIVQRREALLTVSDTVDRTALDRYSFIRDAYLKRRSVQVNGPLTDAESLPSYEDFEAEPADRKALGLPPKN